MRGALVPHAPALLPSVTSSAEHLRELWDGLSRVKIPSGVVVVLLTPHSDCVGRYGHARGSLDGFGIDIEGEFVVAASDLGLPVLEGFLDHGALVPLLLLAPADPLVVVGLGGASDTSDVVELVRGLAKDREVFVLASAHTSVRLSESAPLPYSYDAVRLESRFITEVGSDCAVARDMAAEFLAVGDSCSRSTLEAFGELFAGSEGTVLAYGSPFGVGYPVVTAEIDV